ncbi:hypothetical protein SDC9_77119 [bioreactor metagenome]|uniref:HotDog ACOT-type domain-containing protein n=1 Tax=bioreactor metagenome TaxID=1076179 RepID=A0A644YQH5_9ZZZZ
MAVTNTVVSAENDNHQKNTMTERESLPPDTHLPTDKELVLRVIPMPGDTNSNGDIFGGWVMAQVDLAGSVLPARVAQGRIATVAVKEFIFKQPVRVGDILSFFARIVRVGNTSVNVEVEVFAERMDSQGTHFKVTEATLTYVAIDDHGRPRAMKPQPKA